MTGFDRFLDEQRGDPAFDAGYREELSKILAFDLCAKLIAKLAIEKKEIRGKDRELYLTRYVLWGKPSLGEADATDAQHSAFLHEIHRPDADRDLHDHPWQWGASLILSGGYTEVRGRNQSYPARKNRYETGDLNVIRFGDYHRIASVEPNTWTLFLCGRVVSDWGFLVDGQHVPHERYLREKGLL